MNSFVILKKQNEDPDFSLFKKEGFYFVNLKKEKLTELIIKLFWGKNIFL